MAAELLEFTTTNQNHLELTADGVRFLESTTPEPRKSLWREQILQLALLRKVQDLITRSGGTLAADQVREALVRTHPRTSEAEFLTLISWATYGELFTYDDVLDQLSLHPAAPKAAGPH